MAESDSSRVEQITTADGEAPFSGLGGAAGETAADASSCLTGAYAGLTAVRSVPH